MVYIKYFLLLKYKLAKIIDITSVIDNKIFCIIKITAII